MRFPLLMAAAALAASAASAETPSGLLNLTDDAVRNVPARDWKGLGIGTWELRRLGSIERGDGVRGWAVGYKSGDLSIAGYYAEPPVEYDERGKPKAKYPAVIVCPGGEEGVTPAYRAVVREFAKRGYAAAASSGRGRRGVSGRSEGVQEYQEGEVLDILQLTQLVRKLDHVETQKVVILGFGRGGGAAAQAIGRSNVFAAAVLVSPQLLTASGDHGYVGLRRMRDIAPQYFGRRLSDGEIVREMRSRDAFRQVAEIKTPTLIIAPEPPAYPEELNRWVAALRVAGAPHTLLRYPELAEDFMTAPDDGRRPAHWRDSRDNAWDNVFAWINEYAAPGPYPVE